MSAVAASAERKLITYTVEMRRGDVPHTAQRHVALQELPDCSWHFSAVRTKYDDRLQTLHPNVPRDVHRPCERTLIALPLRYASFWSRVQASSRVTGTHVKQAICYPCP